MKVLDNEITIIIIIIIIFNPWGKRSNLMTRPRLQELNPPPLQKVEGIVRKDNVFHVFGLFWITKTMFWITKWVLPSFQWYTDKDTQHQRIYNVSDCIINPEELREVSIQEEKMDQMDIINDAMRHEYQAYPIYGSDWDEADMMGRLNNYCFIDTLSWGLSVVWSQNLKTLVHKGN